MVKKSDKMGIPDKGVFMDSMYRLHYQDGATHMDNFPEELREVVHEYWARFPPQHPLVGDMLGIAIFLLWCVSFCGNLCVIFIFLTEKSLRTPTNIFIVNLAFSDLCMITTQGLPCSINLFFGDHWMFGALLCRVYACLGGIFGTGSLLTMVVIGFDRYNVICKGYTRTKITPLMAFILLLLIWLYCIAVCVPPFFGWGEYALEGLFITCSYDYLSEDWNRRSFMIYAFIGNYCIPMSITIYFYAQIVRAVVRHESNLRAQAKKMNIDSLRTNQESEGQSAEIKIAKVAITNVCLWAAIWTPYGIIAMLPVFGYRDFLTPLLSQIPAFGAKTASVFNPFVFALSHPRYRDVLAEKCGCFGDQQPVKKEEDNEQGTKMQIMA